MAEQEQNKNDHGEVLAKWNFTEFIKHERSKSWYFGAVISILFLLIYSFLTVNFLFAVIIIIAAISFFLIYRREPGQVTFAITEDGLGADDRFFPYDEIKDFYIIYQPPEVKTLFVELKALTKPRLAISLGDQNPVEIRKILLEYIDEDLEKDDEPLSEGLSRMLKL